MSLKRGVLFLCTLAFLTFADQTSANASPSPDFDGDGTVGFADFLLFAGKFGTQRDEAAFDARYDLDGDGSIGFSDFLVFAASFGKEVSPPAASKLYWTDWGTDKIQRVSEGVIPPGCCTLDVDHYRGYSGR